MERRERTRRKEVLGVAQIGKEISKLRGNVVDPSSGHLPPQAKTGNKKKGNNTRSTTGSDSYSNPTVPSAPQSCQSYTNPTCNSGPKNHHTVTKQVILPPCSTATQQDNLSPSHTVTQHVILSSFHTVTQQVILSPYHTVTQQVILSLCRTAT